MSYRLGVDVGGTFTDVLLVDTGFPADAEALTASIAAAGRTVDDVVAVVVTHAHVDHVGGLSALPAHVPEPLRDAPSTQIGRSRSVVCGQELGAYIPKTVIASAAKQSIPGSARACMDRHVGASRLLAMTAL